MGTVFIILPLIIVYMIFYIYDSWKNQTVHFRDIFINTIVLWAAMIVFITETLSLIRHINHISLVISWLSLSFILACVLGILIFKIRKEDKTFKFISRYSLSKYIENISVIEWVYIALIGFIAITLGVVASVYLPTNYDSLTYHLTRILHWQQNQSLAPYATSIDRQIQMPPFAEEVSLNLLILSGIVVSQNFVQYGAFLVCLIGISSITAKLGGNKHIQLIAVILGASIPMAVLQATSTQNDLVVACLLICFINIGLNLVDIPNPKSAVLTGLALGLSLLTKGTAYVYAIPFCIYIAVKLMIKVKSRAITLGVLIVIMMLLVNAGHYTRMIQVYSNPLGPTDFYKNEAISLNGLASNIIRNTALNFLPEYENDVPKTDINYYINQWFFLIHHLTGLDPVDNRYSMPDWNVFKVGSRMEEDYIGNPIHTIFIIVTCLAVLPLYLMKKISKKEISLFICILSSFLLYCLIFKWQIWGSRLLLPIFLLFTPFISLFVYNHKNWLFLTIPVITGLVACNIIFANQSRPIIPADYALPEGHIYWQAFGPLNRDVARIISKTKCSNVGIEIGGNSLEYLLWYELKQDGFSGRIEHIQVNNETSKFADPLFVPCAVYSETTKLEGYSGWNMVPTEYGAVYYR